jgi:hypothetical protein
MIAYTQSHLYVLGDYVTESEKWKDKLKWKWNDDDMWIGTC